MTEENFAPHEPETVDVLATITIRDDCSCEIKRMSGEARPMANPFDCPYCRGGVQDGKEKEAEKANRRP